jgi:hypothetical protein
MNNTYPKHEKASFVVESMDSQTQHVEASLPATPVWLKEMYHELC